MSEIGDEILNPYIENANEETGEIIPIKRIEIESKIKNFEKEEIVVISFKIFVVKFFK